MSKAAVKPHQAPRRRPRDLRRARPQRRQPGRQHVMRPKVEGNAEHYKAAGKLAGRVAIVTDMAIPADHIDEAKVEEARQRAAARLQDKISDEEVATINASLARSLAQLKVKRRQHG